MELFGNLRCACLLDSGGTILLLWVYRDLVGIKLDSVGTSRQKWPAVSSNVVFLAWFHENNEMAFPKLYPIEWCMYHFASTHTNTWNTVSILMFWGVHKIWSAWRGIKTKPISLRLCTYQLYFNAWHYFPCSNLSMSTKTILIGWWQTRNRSDEFRLTSLLIRWFSGVHGKGFRKIYVQQPWKKTNILVMLYIMLCYYNILPEFFFAITESMCVWCMVAECFLQC